MAKVTTLLENTCLKFCIKARSTWNSHCGQDLEARKTARSCTWEVANARILDECIIYLMIEGMDTP